MALQDKDIVTITVSSIAMIVSFVTFFFNVYQKSRDNRRTIRKELTEVIKEIVETNIVLAKFNIDNPVTSNEIYDLRRSYNTRRRYLINRAEFLFKDIAKYVDHVDYTAIASACIPAGLYEKAEYYFIKALLTSEGIESIFTMRAYAKFLYLNNKAHKGAEIYNAAIDKLGHESTKFSKTVQLRELCDTYLFFAKSEYNIGNHKEADKKLVLAKNVVDGVQIPFLKKELLNIIAQHEFLKSP